MSVVARRRRVRCAIAFSSRLDPDDSVDERRAGVGGRTSTEAGVLDVTPVTPLLTEVLLTGATLVNDEGCCEALRCELRSKSLHIHMSRNAKIVLWMNAYVDVELLVVVGVALGNRIRCGSDQSVVVGDIWTQ